MNKNEKIFIGIFIILFVIAIIISVIIKNRKPKNNWEEVPTDNDYTTETTEYTYENNTTELDSTYPDTTSTKSTTESPKSTTTTEASTQTELVKEYYRIAGDNDYWNLYLLPTSDNYDFTLHLDESTLITVIKGCILDNIDSCPLATDGYKSRHKEGYNLNIDTRKYYNTASNIDLENNKLNLIFYETDDYDNKYGISLNISYSIVDDLIDEITVDSVEEYKEETTSTTEQTKQTVEEYWGIVNFYEYDDDFVLMEHLFITELLNSISKGYFVNSPYVDQSLYSIDYTAYDFTDCEINIETNEIKLKDGTIFEYDYVEEPSLKLTKLQVKEGN